MSMTNEYGLINVISSLYTHQDYIYHNTILYGPIYLQSMDTSKEIYL